MDAYCLDKATGVFYTPQYLDVKESFCSKKLAESNKSVNFDAKMKNMEKIKIYYGVQGDGMTFNHFI